MKKALRETHTLHAGCSKAEPKFFYLSADPFLGVQDGQNLISWDGHYLHLQTQFGEDRCKHFQVTVVTDPQTQTDGTDYNTLCRQLVCSIMKTKTFAQE